MHKYFYFYILKSNKNDKLYLGYSKNPFKRLRLHNKGAVTATKNNTPYKLIYFAGFNSKKDAKACEKYFKTTSGWRRLKRMLQDTLK